jgi:hypothetical protein
MTEHSPWQLPEFPLQTKPKALVPEQAVQVVVEEDPPPEVDLN